MIGKIVEITWVDTIASNVWKYEPDSDLSLDKIKTVGRVLKEDDTTVWLCGTWGGTVSGYVTNNQQIVIPKGTITEIIELGMAGEDIELRTESYREVARKDYQGTVTS
jgi:hypothetical protein